ncbi:hypothetical protein SRHO_G00123220 [Serrasalmus rhombeus]
MTDSGLRRDRRETSQTTGALETIRRPPRESRPWWRRFSQQLVGQKRAWCQSSKKGRLGQAPEPPEHMLSHCGAGRPRLASSTRGHRHSKKLNGDGQDARDNRGQWICQIGTLNGPSEQ